MPTKTIHVDGKELDNVIFQVLRRSSVDPAFRELAMKDGNEAILTIEPNFAGTEALDIHFHDRSNPNPIRLSMNLVLPDLVEAGELSEEELEQVAGGVEASKQFHGVDIQSAA